MSRLRNRRSDARSNYTSLRELAKRIHNVGDICHDGTKQTTRKNPLECGHPGIGSTSKWENNQGYLIDSFGIPHQCLFSP